MADVKAQVRQLVPLCCLALLLSCSSENKEDVSHNSADTLALLSEVKNAILESDHQGLKNKLGQVDVNQPLADGSSLLAWAVESQDPAAVQILLDSGADAASHIGDNSFSPLILACQYGDEQILNRLLDAGAEITVEAYDGISALQLCAGNASAAVLSRMIDAGAEADKPNNLGQTPLMWAAAQGKVDNMSLLIDQGADIGRQTAQGFTTLFFAIKSGALAAPLIAIEAGADIGHMAPDGTSAAQLAIYQQNFEFAYWIVEQGADMEARDRHGHQLLHSAVLENQPALVKLLLEKGANANAVSGPSTLKWRYESNFKMEDYVPPQLPPLYMAAEKGLPEIMEILVSAKAAPDYQTEEENNIVLAAALSGEPDALSLALELLPEPATSNKLGQTPLDIVLFHTSSEQFPDLLRVLEDQGVEIDYESING